LFQVQLFWHFGIAFLRFLLVYKYVDASPLNETRYFHELAEKFESPIRTGLYSLSFYYYHCTYGTGLVLLSVGFNNKYSRSLKGFGYAFAIVIPFGFIFIALFHHFNHYLIMALDSKIPAGPIADKWTNYKDHINLVNPANKRNIDITLLVQVAGSLQLQL
jgi:hypothetical protein